MNAISDKEVIINVLNGNPEFFRIIVDRYKKPVASVIKGMLGDCPEAEDVGQETFIRFYRSISEFRGDSSLKTYLIRIAMNLSLNELKKRKRYVNNTVYIENAGSLNIEAEMPVSDRNDIMEMINMAVEKLDPRQRSVFIMRIVEGYSTKETAKILNIPLGTVLSRLARALEEMRRLIPR